MKKFQLPLAILITGLFFIFFITTENTILLLPFKLLPMILIILYAYKQISSIASGYEKMILFGLLFCALGDALIIFSFLFGLAAFLVGHLFYIVAFINHWHFSWPKFISIIPIVSYALFFGYVLTSTLSQDGKSEFIIPVICYILAISTMAMTAIMTGSTFAIFGSVLFIVSDTILAWNKFISTIPFSSEWIMLTYYGAQFLIASTLTSRSTDTYIKRTSYRY